MKIHHHSLKDGHKNKHYHPSSWRKNHHYDRKENMPDYHKKRSGSYSNHNEFQENSMYLQRNENNNVPGNMVSLEPLVYVVETKLSIYDEKAKRYRRPKMLPKRQRYSEKRYKKDCVRGKGNRKHHHKGTKGIRHYSKGQEYKKRSKGHGHHATTHKGKGHKVAKSVKNKRLHSKGGAHRHHNKGHVNKQRSKDHGHHSSNRKGKGHKVVKSVKNKGRPHSKGGVHRHRNKGGSAASSKTRSSSRANVPSQNETIKNRSNMKTSVISRSGDKDSRYRDDFVQHKKFGDAKQTGVQSTTEVQKAPGIISTKYSPKEHAFKYIMKKKARTNSNHASIAPSPSRLAKTPMKPTKPAKITEVYLQNKKKTMKKSLKPLKN